MRYALIKQEQPRYSIRLPCPVILVHPSDYYVWTPNPVSAREPDNQHLLPNLNQAGLESSGGVYSSASGCNVLEHPRHPRAASCVRPSIGSNRCRAAVHHSTASKG